MAEEGAVTPKRIILFRQGQFGDTLVTFPLLEALRQRFPSTELIYCTNRFRERVFVMGDDVARLSQAVTQTAVYYMEDSIWDKFIALKRALAPDVDDLLLYLPYSTASIAAVVRDFVFFKLLGFSRSHGFRSALDWIVRRNRLSLLRRESERVFEVARAIFPDLVLPERCRLKGDRQWWAEQIKRSGLDERYYVVCPGSKMQSKRWPIEAYCRLVSRIHADLGLKAIVIGGPEEIDLARELAQASGGAVVSRCGVELAQTAAIVEPALFYLGNDTGSMHLAGVLGVPCVVPFSARQKFQLWYPHGFGHRILRKDLPCANCMLEKCYANIPPCLQLISEDEVYAAVLDVLSSDLQ